MPHSYHYAWELFLSVDARHSPFTNNCSNSLFFPFLSMGYQHSALNTLTANTKELTHHINRKKGTNKVVLMKLIKLWSCYLPLIPKRMSSEISFLDASAKLLISSICFSSNLWRSTSQSTSSKTVEKEGAAEQFKVFIGFKNAATIGWTVMLCVASFIIELDGTIDVAPLRSWWSHLITKVHLQLILVECLTLSAC